MRQGFLSVARRQLQVLQARRLQWVPWVQRQAVPWCLVRVLQELQELQELLRCEPPVRILARGVQAERRCGGERCGREFPGAPDVNLAHRSSRARSPANRASASRVRVRLRGVAVRLPFLRLLFECVALAHRWLRSRLAFECPYTPEREGGGFAKGRRRTGEGQVNAWVKDRRRTGEGQVKDR